MFIKVLSIGTIADEKGQYQLKGIPSGTYIVSTSLIGYSSLRLSVPVFEKDVMGINFQLQKEAQSLDEVVIVGKTDARKLRESAQAITVLETGTVKLQTADLGEVLAKTEGVSVQRAGGLGSNTRFAINGLSGDQIRYFYNDIPLEYTPYAAGLANVPINLIDRVEIYKGVVPIRFGADALGGAVNLISSEVKKKWSGSASYQVGSFGTHRATANIGYWNQKSGFFVTAEAFMISQTTIIK